MTDQTDKDLGTDLVKQGQAAATQAEQLEIAQEQLEFEKELKAKLRENGKLLGLEFSPNEGIPSMRQKLLDAREQILRDPVAAEAELKLPEDEQAQKRKLRLENTKLVRIQIACLNPAKSELPGEIFTVHNDIVGTVKKFVPYNEAGEQYHVPMLLLKFLKRKKYLQIKDPPKGSRQPPSTKLVSEFAITILDQLTPAELRELARAQGAAESTDQD